MEDNIDPKDLRVRIRLSVDIPAEKVTYILNFFSKLAKDNNLGEMSVDSITYLGGGWKFAKDYSETDWDKVRERYDKEEI
jgi:hypothetical protein